VTAQSVIYSFQQVSHFDGVRRSVESAVPGFSAGAFDGLLQVIGGNNAVSDGYP